MIKTKTIEKLKVVKIMDDGSLKTIYRTENVRAIGNSKEIQAQAIKVTKEAGNGDILSFEIIKEEVPLNLNEQREILALDLSYAWNEWSAGRENDFREDTGMHSVAKTEKAIENAKKEIADFDNKHPEIANKLSKEKAIETERQIQSALNA